MMIGDSSQIYIQNISTAAQKKININMELFIKIMASQLNKTKLI